MDPATWAMIGSTLLKTLGPLFGGGQGQRSPYEAELVRLLTQLSDPQRFQVLAKPATDYMTVTGERALSRRGMFSSSDATQLQGDIGRTVGQMFMRGQETAVRGWGDLVRGTQGRQPTWGQRLGGVAGTVGGGIEDIVAWYEMQESQEQSRKFGEQLLEAYRAIAGGG